MKKGPNVLLAYNKDIHYNFIVDDKNNEHESPGSSVCYEIGVRNAIYKIEDECSLVQKKTENANSAAACLPKSKRISLWPR